MSVSTAIGRVSESLRSLLIGEMDLEPEVPVTVLTPDEQGGNRRINLFLYKVQESAHLRNADWQVSPTDSSRLVPPPLSLLLYYLMTPYARNDSNLGNATAHEILGEAMRVFYEFPVLPNEYLAGDLGEAREEIRITQNMVDMEELSQIWSTFSEPFRLSVLYEVSVVQLDTSPESQRPLPRRVEQVGVPDVRAPYQPPVVDRMEPISGSAGSTVTFFGSHMEGWQAYVTLLRRRIVDGELITGDQFQITLPGDLVPGFYQLLVDVSHLHRRAFFFEVTT